MEKFGLFNLLSALTSLSQEGGAKDDAQKETVSPPERPAKETGTGIFTAQERAGRAAEILERHERISRNIDRKNR